MSGFIHGWDTSELPRDADDFESGESIPHQEAYSQTGWARCAHCAPVRPQRNETAGRICALLGAIAGGVSGGVKALGVAQSHVGGISNPRFHCAALLSAFTLGVLAGATTGCAAGAALGQRLDEQVMPCQPCLNCRHRLFT